MKKFICLILIALSCLFNNNAFTDEGYQRRAEATAASSHNAVALSMITWGVLLAGLIVLAVVIIPSSSHAD
jgi:hypothetical protein